MLAVASSSAEWLAAGAAVATMVVLLGSAVFALWQLKESQNTRRAELLTELSRRWDEPLLRDARLAASQLTSWDIAKLQRRMWIGQRTPAEVNLYYRLMPIPNFVEAIGVLVLDVDPSNLANIDTLWGGTIIGAWKKWELAIRIMRRKSGLPTSYANFQMLAERLEEFRALKAHRTTWIQPSLMAPGVRRALDVAQ